MRTSNEGFIIFIFLCLLCSISFVSEGADTITTTQSITENETIVSAGGSFELGFFSPGNSKNRYLGIWYKKISTGTVVWLANRQTPIADVSGVLKVIYPGNLVLFNGPSNIIWSSNTSRSVRNPVAQLLESGNLVLRDANDDNPENFLWQSFDYPVDTLLPGMKLGKNLLVGLDRHLSSWKSGDDPAQGDYTYGMNTHGYPQLIIEDVNAVTYRSGPWNGLSFSGKHSLKQNTIYAISFVINSEEVYYAYTLLNKSVVVRVVLSQNGILNGWVWGDRKQGWIIQSAVPIDYCDSYGSCGAYGSCNIDNSPKCKCLRRFVPRYQKDWDIGDQSNGCMRSTSLACHEGEGFLKYIQVKLPDTQNSWFNVTMTLEECGKMCLENCSCMAYANIDIRGEGSGCLLWFGDLIDIREFNTGGQDIYVRMAASELDAVLQVGSNGKRRNRILVILALAIGMPLLFLSLTLFIWRKKWRKLMKKVSLALNIARHQNTDESKEEDLQLPWLEITTIEKATDDFSINNKLGQGGFGPVYKGRMEDGQEIAVKRLSKTSRQGLDEFKNEVICIAKLQHRNLVKLLGCCTQGEERMLIYEFMPNKSLDYFIFDESWRKLLDWPKRYNIINGIARGLLYLHQDSRLRIIHRDIKASNILLDMEMNPKISDFGMARIFGGNETERNTQRVVGTYGYMSPEYAVDGRFSVKSDVFSFGVLMLEIVSGKRNRGFFHSNHNLNLLGHIKSPDGDSAVFANAKVGTTNVIAKFWQEVCIAWTLHQEDRSMELIDPTSKESCCPPEVLRSIHVGLLCVQQHPEDRPSLSSVVLMLGSEGPLPPPKQPGFFTERNLFEADASSSKNKSSSSPKHDLTITELEPR